MNGFRKSVAMTVVSLLLSSGAAFAQDYHRDDHHDDQHHDDQHHDDHHDDGHHFDDHHNDDHGHYVRHENWRHGGRIERNDWNRGRAIDYRSYHLRAPRRGYEWREVDGNYVLASIATGLIASAVVASAGR